MLLPRKGKKKRVHAGDAGCKTTRAAEAEAEAEEAKGQNMDSLSSRRLRPLLVLNTAHFMLGVAVIKIHNRMEGLEITHGLLGVV